MKLEEAITRSPCDKATRTDSRGRIWETDGRTACRQKEKYYNLWVERTMGQAHRFDDWRPAGLVDRPAAGPELTHGLLDPEGRFWACRYGEHRALADGMRFTRYGIKAGAKGRDALDELYMQRGWRIVWPLEILGIGGPTQAQMNAMWDWWRVDPKRRAKPRCFGKRE